MYAKYVTNATTVQSQAISDLALLLTGSPVSALSSSCNKTLSMITPGAPAPGWTLVDSAAPQSGQVISAPDADGLTTKYVRLHVYSAVQFSLTGSESWDATAHTGLNPTTAGSTSTALLVTDAPGMYHLFVTPRSFYICKVGNSPANAVGVGAFEFTREAEHLKGTTYPCFVIANGTVLSGIYNTFDLPRTKDVALTSGDTNSFAQLQRGTMGIRFGTTASGNVPKPPAGPSRAVNDVPYYEFRPVFLIKSLGSYSHTALVYGRLYDVVDTTPGIGNLLDTFPSGSVRYSLVAADANSTVLIRN